MRSPGELTSAELSKCYELSSGLLDLKDCLPDRLAVILDTFRTDLAAEREDRAGIEAADRLRAAQGATGM